MTNLGVFTEEELELVSNISYIVAPNERKGEGLTLQVVNGLRTWSIHTRFGQATAKGWSAAFSGCYTLSPRFVREAEYLANLGEPVEIIIDGNMAYARNDMGQATMALANKTRLVERLSGEHLTTVELSQVSLTHLLTWGSNDPAAFVSEEEMGKIPCLSVFTVKDGMLGVSAPFEALGCSQLSSYQYASVAGPHGDFGLDRIMTRRTASFLNDAGNIPITVSIDMGKGNLVQFAGANWALILNRMNIGAGNYYPEVIEALREAKHEFIESDDASICATIEGEVILLELLDGRWPVVRCTIELVSGVKRTFDLLEEIDQQNEGRVNTKYFMRDNTVVASIDVRCDGLEHLDQELKALVADSYLLGEYLASLGVVGEELTLF
jgi:hypothetical protein